MPVHVIGGKGVRADVHDSAPRGSERCEVVGWLLPYLGALGIENHVARVCGGPIPHDCVDHARTLAHEMRDSRTLRAAASRERPFTSADTTVDGL